MNINPITFIQLITIFHLFLIGVLHLEPHAKKTWEKFILDNRTGHLLVVLLNFTLAAANIFILTLN